ncbi:putative alkaline shock family protein YloU [Tepidibacillus fermentans]|uniref:Putative alkaline shock family protein YloU n=2 Tax=Tepidibacillus fermentans TaxID=1281767 RepID=A0A4R3KDI3_9BACI|nr:putative alkaline shock family protein YloU [Tepidibacillus fermentans]
MMTEERETGKIKIESDVVAMIAGLAATDTEGVASMSGGITEGLAKRVSGKNVTKGVRVEVGETETAIDIRVVIKYGYKIHEVARKLQQNVKEAVESMTGLHVVEVNIHVEGVELQKEEHETEEENIRLK